MPKDYSTPPSPDSRPAAGWVKGDLPSSQATPSKSKPAPAPVEDTRRAAKTRPVEPRRLEPAVAAESTNGALSLEALVESLLFVADGAVPVAQIAEALEVSPREVEAALSALSQVYRRRGLSLQRFRDRVQLTTAPGAAEYVQRFLGLAATAPLTRASLETLAIIAYQQPVTRPRIEAIRGVNCDSVLQNLLSKGLIEEVGRTDGPGRPVLYATTAEFMQYFGLTSLSDLPPLNLDAPPVLSDPHAAPAANGAPTSSGAAALDPTIAGAAPAAPTPPEAPAQTDSRTG